MSRTAEAYRHALLRVVESTQIPFARRSDVNFLRAAVMLARVHAEAGLRGKEAAAPPVLPGQLDMFTEAE